MNRAEFFAKLEPFHSPSSLLDIELAYTLAKYGHRAQVRRELGPGGEPLRYFEHVRRVAVILVDEMMVSDKTMICAALLHDGFEDTRDLTPEMIEHAFGEDVVRLVKVLSKVPKEGYIERFNRCTDWRAYAIKACDRLDNLRSLDGANDPAFKAKTLLETEKIYMPLFHRMIALTTPFHKQASYDMVAKIWRFLETQ